MSGDETERLTYRQAADKLGVSPQAVRQKAIRGRWARRRANTGQALVQVPEETVQRVRTVSGQAPDVSLVDALREHNASLKTENERLVAQLASESAKTAQAIAAFQSLAERLEAIAEARRPWWRRLVG